MKPPHLFAAAALVICVVLAGLAGRPPGTAATGAPPAAQGGARAAARPARCAGASPFLLLEGGATQPVTRARGGAPSAYVAFGFSPWPALGCAPRAL
jgi:hypothetical protein